MKERPILFSGPMVRAILADRKKVTRRVLKPQPEQSDIIVAWRWYGRTFAGGWSLNGTPPASMLKDCPYGQPGDRLWVKETWRPRASRRAVGWDVTYAADGQTLLADLAMVPATWRRPKAAETGNVTPLHMPRWASRLTLEVVSVKVERLHGITEEEARAEGVEPKRGAGAAVIQAGPFHLSHVVGFRELWCDLNGTASWDADPWVWRVEFKRVEVAR